MLTWFTSLGLLTQIFFCIAVPASLWLLVQTILSLVGGDFDSGDADLPDDLDFNGFGDLQIISLRTILAFLCTFGWMGFTVLRNGGRPSVAVIVAILTGAAVMLGVAFLLRAIYRLQSDGTRVIENAVGVSGSVYLTVPPSRSGQGKVNLMLQGAYEELDAVTDGEEELPFGTAVTVTGILGEGTLIVRRADVASQHETQTIQ